MRPLKNKTLPASYSLATVVTFSRAIARLTVDVERLSARLGLARIEDDPDAEALRTRVNELAEALVTQVTTMAGERSAKTHGGN